MEIDWKMCEQNNKTIALNIWFIPHNTKTIRLAYKSKYNRRRENQVVLLMITDGKKWHYLALKRVRVFSGEKYYNRPIRSLKKLLRGKTSNRIGDYYCLSCFHSYSTDNTLKNMKDYMINMITVVQPCQLNTIKYWNTITEWNH